MTDTIRVRIPPSPTGKLHVGNARTALFNELFARNKNATFILRIEDTDTARSKPEYEQNIIEGLQWLGLEWHEGPDKGGPYGPYRQSERTSFYLEALKTLLEQGKAYYCECAVGAKNCPCADKKLNNPTLPVRLHVTPQEITFTDHVRGEVTTHTDTFGGSFIIARSLEAPLYHLAVVVDDALMKISHIIRGEDHLSNTPKHILIQHALGYPQPEYAHLPLLVDEQRRKLSKRKHNTDLLSYRDLGYLPETMLNYLALLGWSPKNDQEFFTHDELIERFDLHGVQKGSAVFSLIKLNHMNQQYIRKLSPTELWEQTKPFLVKADISLDNTELLQKALLTEKSRVNTLAELASAVRFFVDSDFQYAPELLLWKKSTTAETKKCLKLLIDQLVSFTETDFTEPVLKEKIVNWIDGNALGRGETLWPMRVALTGQEHSAGPFEVSAVLGKAETIRRLTHAHDTLST